MNEQQQQTQQTEQTANVYKTSKTTWFLVGLMVVILGIIVWMMMKKKDTPAPVMMQ